MPSIYVAGTSASTVEFRWNDGASSGHIWTIASDAIKQGDLSFFTQQTRGKQGYDLPSNAKITATPDSSGQATKLSCLGLGAIIGN